jgi:hypothetical protein
MNGFGFVEYEDPMDAKDVVPGKTRAIMTVSLLLILRQLSV